MNSITPLHFAAQAGHKQLAQLLISNGANVNAKDEHAVTPLHYAASEGQKELAELLIATDAFRIDKVVLRTNPNYIP